MADGAHDVELIAEESFVYLHPLVLMDITRKQLTIGVGAGDQPICDAGRLR